MTQDIEYDEWVVYLTRQGDTFDSLSMDMYGTELLASEIIKENPVYCDVIIFPADIELYLPVIKSQDTTSKPPWERGVV